MSPQLGVFPGGKAPAASARSAAGAAPEPGRAGSAPGAAQCALSRSRAQAQHTFNIDFSTAAQVRDNPLTPKRAGVSRFPGALWSGQAAPLLGDGYL